MTSWSSNWAIWGETRISSILFWLPVLPFLFFFFSSTLSFLIFTKVLDKFYDSTPILSTRGCREAYLLWNMGAPCILGVKLAVGIMSSFASFVMFHSGSGYKRVFRVFSGCFSKCHGYLCLFLEFPFLISCFCVHDDIDSALICWESCNRFVFCGKVD